MVGIKGRIVNFLQVNINLLMGVGGEVIFLPLVQSSTVYHSQGCAMMVPGARNTTQVSQMMYHEAKIMKTTLSRHMKTQMNRGKRKDPEDEDREKCLRHVSNEQVKDESFIR